MRLLDYETVRSLRVKSSSLPLTPQEEVMLLPSYSGRRRDSSHPYQKPLRLCSSRVSYISLAPDSPRAQQAPLIVSFYIGAIYTVNYGRPDAYLAQGFAGYPRLKLSPYGKGIRVHSRLYLCIAHVYEELPRVLGSKYEASIKRVVIEGAVLAAFSSWMLLRSSIGSRPSLDTDALTERARGFAYIVSLSCFAYLISYIMRRTGDMIHMLVKPVRHRTFSTVELT